MSRIGTSARLCETVVTLGSARHRYDFFCRLERGKVCLTRVNMVHAVVITLGDLGRSPRMQYHAQSLCQMDELSRVTAVGYAGEVLIPGMLWYMPLPHIDHPSYFLSTHASLQHPSNASLTLRIAALSHSHARKACVRTRS